MANTLEITYYERTGYNPSDEPANDAVINLNAHWTAPPLLKDYDPRSIQNLKVRLSDDDLRKIDFVKIRDVDTNERWYYYVTGHQRVNGLVVHLGVALDAFATVGLDNISFFGNVARRSLSASERATYPLLPEPWAPRRPLLTRRMIIDLNVNKNILLPSHVSQNFEEELTVIEPDPNPVTVEVPNSPLNLTTTTDGLSFHAELPVGYPNPAADTTHTIATPWGAVQYVTPYESYYTLNGSALTTFLAKAKMYNALDLVDTPYYLPNPGGTHTISLGELSNPTVTNPKASRFYTTVTIRSLAANAAHTYTDTDTNLQPEQTLAVVIAPDKNGGIYVLPTTIRDTGLNAYTYLDGVYSPFETVQYNAIGDTPAKYASDGTVLLNTALNALYKAYSDKINAMQYQNMLAKYISDVGTKKGLVMSFAAELLGLVSETVTTTYGHWQNSTSATSIPTTTSSVSQSQYTPGYSQSQSQTTSSPAHSTTQTTTQNMPAVYGNSTSSTSVPAVSSQQNSYSYNAQANPVIMPTIYSYTQSHTTPATTNTRQSNYTSTSTTSINSPLTQQTTTGTVNIPAHNISISGTTTQSAHTQSSTQSTWIAPQDTRSVTTQDGSSRSVDDGNQIAVDGISSVYETASVPPITDPVPGIPTNTPWGMLKNVLAHGYRNEVHAFMLGNINDYVNRWVSLQNDMQNGKVANLFKNVTLVGAYNDYNKLAGKFEILVASLHPDDELNFDLFLSHFGHAVDEYTNTLVADVRDNYNYTMVGEDAILANTVLQDANAQILNQFRTGVRVWKTLVKPENY